MRSLLLILIVAAAGSAVLGCSDDSTAPTGQASSWLIEGEIGDADFEISVGAARSANGVAEGPFVLRGSNLQYVDSLQALVVDLSIRNDGDIAHAEPVGITFLNFIPEGVTLQNPDNGINGDGAAIEFDFANDDGLWTPGETSLPKTLQFGVAKGTSIGFTAQLDLGEAIDGGTIAGRVWNDANEDGVIDSGEDGIAEVLVLLQSISGEDSVATDSDSTLTDEDGNYAFDGLEAGVYVVSKPEQDGVTPTTPTEITVLLTETDTDVGNFLDANFGCLTSDDPDPDPDPFPVGVFIEANGDFRDNPNRLVAQGIDVSRCGDDDDDDDENSWIGIVNRDGDDDDDDNDDEDCDREDCESGKLRGPVTEIDEENFTFAVMGTWVSADESTFPDDLEVGDRVDVRLHHGDEDELIVDRVKEWHNDRHEQVHGRVDSVEVDDDGNLRLTVLNTIVIVSLDHHDTQ
jgi:hypothetical protein